MENTKAIEVVQVIPDLQAPFEHKDALEFCKAVRKKYRPTKIINVGDEADKHALGDYDSDPDGYSAGHELHKCIEHLEPWYKAFPQTMVCTSNHTDRIFRKAYKHGIPRAYLKQYREFLEAPEGWVWQDEWEIDGVLYEHGHSLGGMGRNATYQLPLMNRQSTVFGHFHAFAGFQYIVDRSGRRYFGMNAGCLIDQKAYAFRYGSKLKNKPVLGCGIVDRGTPHYVPMKVDRHKRWTGEL